MSNPLAEVGHAAYRDHGQRWVLKTSGKWCWGGGRERNQTDSFLTYGFSFPKKQLVASQSEVASFPPFDKLPADLLLFKLAFNQRLAVLIYNWGGEHTTRGLFLSSLRPRRKPGFCCDAEKVFCSLAGSAPRPHSSWPQAFSCRFRKTFQALVVFCLGGRADGADSSDSPVHHFCYSLSHHVLLPTITPPNCSSALQ